MSVRHLNEHGPLPPLRRIPIASHTHGPRKSFRSIQASFKPQKKQTGDPILKKWMGSEVRPKATDQHSGGAK